MGIFKKKHKQMSFEAAIASIEKALLSDYVLHTFRSGGGLQVARIEKVKGNERRGDLSGYGEHPNINEALGTPARTSPQAVDHTPRSTGLAIGTTRRRARRACTRCT